MSTSMQSMQNSLSQADWPQDAFGSPSAEGLKQRKGAKREVAESPADMSAAVDSMESMFADMDTLIGGAKDLKKGNAQTSATTVVADIDVVPGSLEQDLAAFNDLTSSSQVPAQKAPAAVKPATTPTKPQTVFTVDLTQLKLFLVIVLSIAIFMLAPTIVHTFTSSFEVQRENQETDAPAGSVVAAGMTHALVEFAGLSAVALLLTKGYDKQRKLGASKQATPSAEKAGKAAAAAKSSDADAEEGKSNPALMRGRHAIHNAIKIGDMETALKTLEDMELNGPKPDAITYNLMIRGCILKADVESAEQYFERMVNNEVTPSLCSYNMLLDAFAKANRMDWCDSLMKQMAKDGIKGDTITFGTMMTVRARRGEKAIAEGLLKQMIADGIEPDAICYNALVHASAVVGDRRGAEKWSEEMRSRGLSLTVATYTALIDACAKAGDILKAESWLEKMHQAGIEPNVVSYGSLLDACARQCDPVRAERWYRQMIDHGIVPNSHTFSALVTACGRAKDPKTAETWLCRAELAGVLDSVIYSGVIDAYSKLDDGEGAERIFNRMKAVGVQPHVVAYASLIRPFSRSGDYTKVEQVLKEMEEKGVAWNEYVLFSLLLAYSVGKPKAVTRPRAEAAFRKAMADGLPTNVHVTGALARNLGRQRTHELMAEFKLPPPAK